MNTILIAMLLNKYSITSNLEPKSSYYSPTNLFIMDLNNDVVIEKYESGFCLVRTLPLTEQRTISFLGPVKDDLIKKFQNSADYVIESIMPEAPFTIDRDNAEYIYATKNLITLAGATYKEVRRKINKVSIDTIRFEFFPLSEIDKIESDLWSFFEGQSTSSDINAQIEEMAFEKWLMFADQLPTQLIIAIKDEETVGFGVVEVVGETLLIHFFKTEHTIIGLAEYLFVELARMFEKQVEWINFQQDLGIEGLRNFKNHLQPCMQLLTYLSLRSASGGEAIS